MRKTSDKPCQTTTHICWQVLRCLASSSRSVGVSECSRPSESPGEVGAVVGAGKHVARTIDTMIVGVVQRIS